MTVRPSISLHRDVAVGSIVIQGDLGNHQTRHQAGSLGSIAVEGVFDIPKDPALAVEFEAGTKVYVDEDGAVSLTMLAPSTSAKS